LLIVEVKRIEEGGMVNKPLDLEDRLVDFAVRVVNVVEALPHSKAGNQSKASRLRRTIPKNRDCLSFANHQSSIINR